MAVSSVLAAAQRARGRRIAAAALGLALLAAAPAQARPVSRLIDLVSGTERFFRASGVSAVSVEGRETLDAELLPSGELLITPKRPGRALLFLAGDGFLEVARVRVREVGGTLPEDRASEAELATAARACSRLVQDREGNGRRLSATISSPACREALRDLLARDDFVAERLELMFTPETVKAQLEAIRAELERKGLAGAFEVSYRGLSLQITGQGTREQKMELLQAIYDQSVGRVLLEDQSELIAPAEAADASGAQQPAPASESAESR